MYEREGDQLHANEGSGSPVLLTPEGRPSERQKLMLKCCEDMQNLDPSFLSMRSPHLGVLANYFTSVKVCRPFPILLPSHVTVRNWPPESPRSPQSGVDNNFTSVEVTDPRSQPSQDRLFDETAMAKLPSPTMDIARDEHGIAPAMPSIRMFECRTCHEKFSTFQALGGHTTGHMKRRPATKLRGMTSLTQRGTVAGRHECSICGKGFPSGQALGGHMRLHKDKDVGNMQDKEIGIRLLRSNNMDLDLNVPHKPTVLPSGRKMYLWL